MSTYTVTELIQRWKNGKIDTTQAVGHILQHLEMITQQQRDCTSNIATLKASLEEMANRIATQAAQGCPTAPKRRNP